MVFILRAPSTDFNRAQQRGEVDTRNERFLSFVLQRGPYEAVLEETLPMSELAVVLSREYFAVNIGDRKNFPSFKEGAFSIQQGTLNTIFVSMK